MGSDRYYEAQWAAPAKAARAEALLFDFAQAVEALDPAVFAAAVRRAPGMERRQLTRLLAKFGPDGGAA